MATEKLWSALIHLGGNMWNEEGNWNDSTDDGFGDLFRDE